MRIKLVRGLVHDLQCVDKILKSWPEDISGVHFTVNSERNEVKIVIYWFNGMNTQIRGNCWKVELRYLFISSYVERYNRNQIQVENERFELKNYTFLLLSRILQIDLIEKSRVENMNARSLKTIFLHFELLLTSIFHYYYFRFFLKIGSNKILCLNFTHIFNGKIFKFGHDQNNRYRMKSFLTD